MKWFEKYYCPYSAEFPKDKVLYTSETSREKKIKFDNVNLIQNSFYWSDIEFTIALVSLENTKSLRAFNPNQ